MVPSRADIEAIKQLKADYFRLLDSKQWEAWGELFTKDALLDSSDDSPDGVARGRQAIVAMVSQALAEASSRHSGSALEVELLASDRARALWEMEDRLVFGGQAPALVVEGRGHYHESYKKGADGRWRIEEMRLKRSRLVHNGRVLIG